MSTEVSAPFLLRRVAARAGAGMWRHRGGVLLAAVATAAIGGFVALNPISANIPLALGGGSAGIASSDCADTAMAAIADKSPNAAQNAYQCMDPAFQQRVPEQAFVQQIQTQSLSNVMNVARVGDYKTQAGGSMVYYAVDANGQSVGYIVYLGQDGKVLRIE